MRKAFTLIELLVVLAIVGLLISIVVPVLGRARKIARDATCLGQLSQMSTGWYAMTAQSSGLFPNTVTPGTGSKWDDKLLTEMGIDKNSTNAVYGCPTVLSDFGPDYNLAGRTTYGVNVRWSPDGPAGENEGQRLTGLAYPSLYPLMADTFVNTTTAKPLIYDEIGVRLDQDWRIGFYHEQETANVTYADGHTENVERDVLDGPADKNGVPLFFFNAVGGQPQAALQGPSSPTPVLALRGLW